MFHSEANQIRSKRLIYRSYHMYISSKGTGKNEVEWTRYRMQKVILWPGPGLKDGIFDATEFSSDRILSRNSELRSLDCSLCDMVIGGTLVS